MKTHPLTQVTLLESPFSRADSRYRVYWPVAAAGEADRRRAELVADRDSLALDARTVDKVAFGEQQPESDHGFRGEQTRASVDAQGRRARATAATMAVDLQDPDRKGRVLRVGYRHSGGPTGVAVRLNGVLVAEETWDGEQGAYEIDYGLPGPRATAYELEFTAPRGKATPGITMARLLR